jgi:hypothetical protein
VVLAPALDVALAADVPFRFDTVGVGLVAFVGVEGTAGLPLVKPKLVELDAPDAFAEEVVVVLVAGPVPNVMEAILPLAVNELDEFVAALVAVVFDEAVPVELADVELLFARVAFWATAAEGLFVVVL